MIQERSAAYMTARTSYRERRGLMEQVNRYALARPPRGIPVEEQQLHAWLGVLKFEKRNTLKADDGGVARTLFAYRQCLSHLRYYPEIWFGASGAAFRLWPSSFALADSSQARGGGSRAARGAAGTMRPCTCRNAAAWTRRPRCTTTA